MHAGLSTVCNYEITPDPLYPSIIIAFYVSAEETAANFSAPRARALEKSFSIFLPAALPSISVGYEGGKKRGYIHSCQANIIIHVSN